MRSTITTALALGLATTQAYAQIAQQTQGDITYGLNIPESTVSSGTGDIFFQIQGPTSYQWIALGQGNQMSGSTIFLMYTDGAGSNVTISGRHATGYNQPQHDASIDLTLLEGSGVSNGVMTANVRCGNCDSKVDLKSSSGSWIYAYKSGSSLDSDDVSETISQHDDASPFTWDMSAGQGGSSVNPFVAAGSTSGSTDGSSASGSSVSCIPRPTSASAGAATTTQGSATTTDTSTCPPWGCQAPSWASGRPTGAPNGYGNNGKRQSVPYCDEIGSGSGESGSGRGSSSFENEGIPFGGNQQKAKMVFMAHGIMASLAFVILFPIGGILIRVASFPGLWWIHGVFQLFAYVVYIAAFGLGIYMATQTRQLNNHHPIIGIVLFIIVFFQPAFGWMHHVLYKKYGHRTLWSYAHLSIGRIAILLGMVNGGLGLQLARNASTGQITAYAVVAAIMAVLYIAAIVYGELKRRKRAPPSYDETQKGIRLSDRSSDDEAAAARQNHEFYAKPPNERS